MTKFLKWVEDKSYERNTGSIVGGRRPTISGATVKKNRRRQLCGPTAPPRHVHCNDWKEMLELTRRRDEGERAAAEPIHGSDKDLAIYDTDVEELRAVEAVGPMIFLFGRVFNLEDK